jgi:hypothetical protein
MFFLQSTCKTGIFTIKIHQKFPVLDVVMFPEMYPWPILATWLNPVTKQLLDVLLDLGNGILPIFQ